MQHIGVGTARAPTFGELPRTSREIVICLRRNGEMSAVDISARLHLAVSTIRMGLAPLREAGFVSHREVGSGRGRRGHVYSLTHLATELFPTLPSTLVQSLLRFIHDREPEVIDDFLEKLVERGLRRAEAAGENEQPAAPLDRLVAAYQQLGFLVELITENDRDELVVHHCPLASLAQEFPSLCRRETLALTNLLDRPVARTEWRLERASLCRYTMPADGSTNERGSSAAG